MALGVHSVSERKQGEEFQVFWMERTLVHRINHLKLLQIFHVNSIAL